jgi:NAD-dependent deacetylase
LTRSLRAADCDVFLTVGTSAVVHPAASLVDRAKQHGAFTVEINLEPTPASGNVDVSLQGSADQILLAIDEHRAT